jgi:Enolase C-terminal domain-like
MRQWTCARRASRGSRPPARHCPTTAHSTSIAIGASPRRSPTPSFRTSPSEASPGMNAPSRRPRTPFQPFAEAGAYDVMMPDIKYIGGIDEMRRTADLLTRHGIVTSPHNPTGPICHAVSIALCAALPQTGRLELQLDETPLFDDLVAGACPSPAGGAVTVPTAAGHGLSLASAPLDRLRSVRKFVA